MTSRSDTLPTPLLTALENRSFAASDGDGASGPRCAWCGGPYVRRAYRGGRAQRYCGSTCQRLGWCRDQLERAGYTVGPARLVL